MLSLALLALSIRTQLAVAVLPGCAIGSACIALWCPFAVYVTVMALGVEALNWDRRDKLLAEAYA